MNDKALNEHDERTGGFLEEKQERREFLRNIGKAALPAIAFLGLGAIGSRLNGNQHTNNSRSRPSVGCETGCKGDCEGCCRGGCDGGCSGDCSSGCKGDCSGTCKGDASISTSGGISSACRSK